MGIEFVDNSIVVADVVAGGGGTCQSVRKTLDVDKIRLEQTGCCCCCCSRQHTNDHSVLASTLKEDDLLLQENTQKIALVRQTVEGLRDKLLRRRRRRLKRWPGRLMLSALLA